MVRFLVMVYAILATLNISLVGCRDAGEDKIAGHRDPAHDRPLAGTGCCACFCWWSGTVAWHAGALGGCPGGRACGAAYSAPSRPSSNLFVQGEVFRRPKTYGPRRPALRFLELANEVIRTGLYACFMSMRRVAHSGPVGVRQVPVSALRFE